MPSISVGRRGGAGCGLYHEVSGMSLQRSRIAGSIPRRSGPAQYPLAGGHPIAIANFVDRVLSHVSNIRISGCRCTPTDTIHQRPIYSRLTFPRLSHIVKEGKVLVNNEDLIEITKAGYEIYLAGRPGDLDKLLAWQQLSALDAILAGKDALWNPDDRKFVDSLWGELVLLAPEVYLSSRVTYASLKWVRKVLRLVAAIEAKEGMKE